MKLPRRLIKIISDPYVNATRSQSLLLSRNEKSIEKLKE